MVQHPQPQVPAGGVVRISRRAILLELCKELSLQPPEFTCHDGSTDDDGTTTFIAEATVWYCPAGGDDDEGGQPPLTRKITGAAPAATREEAVEQVSEDAISFLREEMNLAIDDFNYPAVQMQMQQVHAEEAELRRAVDEMDEAVGTLGANVAGFVGTIRALKELKELVASGAVLHEDDDVTKGLLPEFAGGDFNMEGARKVLGHVAEGVEVCYESACERLGRWASCTSMVVSTSHGTELASIYALKK